MPEVQWTVDPKGVHSGEIEEYLLNVWEQDGRWRWALDAKAGGTLDKGIEDTEDDAKKIAVARAVIESVKARRKLPPDTPPGMLGLTHEQMKICQAAVNDANKEAVSIKELIGALESVLVRMDSPENGPLSAVLEELEEWRALRDIGIAMFAFKKGLQAGREAATEQKEPG